MFHVREGGSTGRSDKGGGHGSWESDNLFHVRGGGSTGRSDNMFHVTDRGAGGGAVLGGLTTCFRR